MKLTDEEKAAAREDFEERAAILEYEANMTRDEAEKMARQLVMKRLREAGLSA